MNKSNKTQALGIIGYPISHSMSPLMHNTAINHHKLNFHYLPFEVSPKNLGAAVKGIKALGIKGINVTIPHKEKIIKHLDELSKEAKLIGAVNTVLNKNGKLVGYNTDGVGFIKSMKEEIKLSPKEKSVLLIGAGGACRAVSVQLALSGVKKIVLANRTEKKAKLISTLINNKIKNKLSSVISSDKTSIEKILPDIDIIINTTSLGMNNKNDIKDFPYELLTKKHTVCDLVYNPLKTYFLRESKKSGATTLEGLGMLIYQGDAAFNIWTKKKLPISLIKPILKKKLLAKS